MALQHLSNANRLSSYLSESLDGSCYVTGFRGCRKLKVGSYSFTKNKVVGDRTYWSCARASQDKCKARVMTIWANGRQHTVVRSSEHNHSPF